MKTEPPKILGRKSAALSVLDCWIRSVQPLLWPAGANVGETSRETCLKQPVPPEEGSEAGPPRVLHAPHELCLVVLNLPGANLVGTSSAGTASAWPPSYSHQLLTVCFSFAIGFRGSGANKVRAVLILKAGVCF